MSDRVWNDLRLSALLDGDKSAWDAFVARHANLIYAAIRRAFAAAGRPLDDADDIFQDVFVRLAANEYRLLRQYDPARAALSTWLTIVARSTALNVLRRRWVPTETKEAAAEIPDESAGPPSDPLLIPDDLLTPRQRLIMALTYEDDLDAPEIGVRLGIDPQTVRSTRHKALTRLRDYFAELDSENSPPEGDELP